MGRGLMDRTECLSSADGSTTRFNRTRTTTATATATVTFPLHPPLLPLSPLLLSMARTMDAAAAQMKLRHITLRDQNELASSSEKSTPPMGAPKAAARPQGQSRPPPAPSFVVYTHQPTLHKVPLTRLIYFFPPRHQTTTTKAKYRRRSSYLDEAA